MHRVFVEKKPGFTAEAGHLFHELKESLGLPGLASVRIVQRYDLGGLSDDEFATATRLILSEPQVDTTAATLSLADDETAFAVEYLPGQFDQRADSAAQCVQILTGKERPFCAAAKVIILRGSLDAGDFARIKDFVINAVDSHEVPVAEPYRIQNPLPPADVPVLEGFASRDPAAVRAELGLAMSPADVAFCQSYFRDEEGRDPTLTEIRMLDTYWSDHCRHTTFLSSIERVTFDDPDGPAARAWQTYLEVKKQLGRDDKPVTLMDIALAGMRELKATGELDNLEESDEVNAACIVVPIEISNLKSEISNPVRQDWLVMFKNETHNHPTEIEPFGGAATCLGGCIRDPLSGRSYVYQAMRVTGAANPLAPFADTLPGKLPQKKICRIAAHGYSSYGNQIGLATGQVAEIYHPGYVAKRLEIGAVVAAAPRSQVFRGKPAPGDAILLIGGRTGRDGVGGATGSSKEHTDTALENSAEVQKGDAPTERKIQRLFRNPELARKIKVCNDFGAGGVSVAIGEIAPSLDIDLDAVPKKYDGLDGTELAISESQERMAVCVDPSEVPYFIAEADRENLECTRVATVTDTGRLVMTWRGSTIVNLSRAFLNTNGVQQSASVQVAKEGTGAPPKPLSPLTASVEYHHEHGTSLLERCPPEILRASLGLGGERAAVVLRGVHRANEKAGIPVPQTASERHNLHKALRSVEEREIRRRLSDLFVPAGEFEAAWTKAGNLGGAEQKVFPTPDGSAFVKANNGSYHGHWLQYFDRLHLHRLLFPDTAYQFSGFLDDAGELAVVVRQPTIVAIRDGDGKPVGANREQVEAHMTALGAFRVRNDDYYLPAEDLFIEDLHDENVLVGTDGLTLHFIDPVIYQRPADMPVPVSATQSRHQPAPALTSLAHHLRRLNLASQRGLGEMFDGSVGAGTVLWPFGGKHQLTPPDAMAAKLPLLEGDTDACTFMSWGYDPYIASASPFHGAVFAVTESVCKAVAAGARLSDIRLTLQEYFPKLGTDPQRWGLPFAALLGAFHAQHELRIAAIGGKDSMSGTFNDLDVPPTLVSFALAPGKASLALSPEFKRAGSAITLVETRRDADGLPDFDHLKEIAGALHDLNTSGKLLSLHHIGSPGLAAALAKCCFGNRIGFAEGTARVPRAAAGVPPDAPESTTGEAALYQERHFSFLLEHEPVAADFIRQAIPCAREIGRTIAEPTLILGGETHHLTDLQAAWEATLEPVYPTRPEASAAEAPEIVDVPLFPAPSTIHRPRSPIARPKVLIPAFPGTNSEYDSAKAFREAGAEADILVIRNLTAQHIEESLAALAESIRRSQILMLPGGFSAGDEPDGSAKFIATIIRSPRVADAIMDLLKNRDGLVLGICNGFQALIKTGLVPYGEISDLKSQILDPTAPTLVHNTIGRHISRYAQTRVASALSPWFALCQPGGIHTIPLSHGEGRFFASTEVIADLAAAGQIATQYCDESGTPSMDIAHNPNGSLAAIEGITSPCGRVLGKMGHTERAGSRVAKNIPGNKHQPLFAAGVGYFK